MYTIKPSVGLISTKGIFPASDIFDSAGPLAKSAWDIAALLDIMIEDDYKNENYNYPKHGYINCIKRSWTDTKVRIGVLDPSEWLPNESGYGNPDNFLAQQVENNNNITSHNVIDMNVATRNQCSIREIESCGRKHCEC